MSLAGNSWCPSQITFLSWDLKGGSCVCLGIVVAVTTFDWPCCRLVVTSEPLDLDLNAARRGAVWWKRRCSICCASCAQSFWTVTLRFQLKFMKYGSQLRQRRFFKKLNETLDNFGYPDLEQQHHFHNCCAFDAIFGSKKRRTKKPTQTPKAEDFRSAVCRQPALLAGGFPRCYPWGAELPDVAMTIKYSRESKNPSKAGLRFLNLPKTFFVKERNRTQPQNSEITFIPFLIHHFNHVFPDYGWTHTHTQIDAGYSEYLSHHTRTFGHLGIWLPWIDALRPARLRVWISECDLDGQEW